MSAQWEADPADLARIQMFERGGNVHRYMCLRVFARAEMRDIAEASEAAMLRLWDEMSESERAEVLRALGALPDPLAN